MQIVFLVSLKPDGVGPIEKKTLYRLVPPLCKKNIYNNNNYTQQVTCDK